MRLRGVGIHITTRPCILIFVLLDCCHSVRGAVL
jgi:hypothetical protein